MGGREGRVKCHYVPTSVYMKYMKLVQLDTRLFAKNLRNRKQTNKKDAA